MLILVLSIGQNFLGEEIWVKVILKEFSVCANPGNLYIGGL
jgi:hypothetical protein